MRKHKPIEVEYDENVNYDELKQHNYDGDIFYECPLCGREYLATFIVEEDGQTMCIDCWNEVMDNNEHIIYAFNK